MGTGRARSWGRVAICLAAALGAFTDVDVARGDRTACDHANQACAHTESDRGRPSSPTPPPARGGYADPSRELGASSPTCRYALEPEERRNCRGSGSVAQRYPLSSYGIDVRVGFSLTDMGESFLGALQNIAALIWMGLVFLLKAVLLLLEWAFSLDLTSRAMPDAHRTLVEL